MGVYDSFWAEAKCPYCGNVKRSEFQTKELRCCLDNYYLGDEVYGGIHIKEGKIHGAIAGCTSKQCEEWEKKKLGYNSGFGRQFRASIVLREGKFIGITDIVEDDE